MDRKSVLRNANIIGLDFDYPLAKTSKKDLVKLTKEIKQRIKIKLLPRTKIIEDFKIVFVSKTRQNALGEYVFGSSWHWKPIILLNLKSIEKECRSIFVSLLCGIETTILHELAHAIQDKTALEFDEQEAEVFAEEYFNYGIVRIFWR